MAYKGTELIILIDPERCMGCRSCEIACAIEHSISKNLYAALIEKPKPKPRITVLPVSNFTVPMRCQHCKDAPCMAVCPTQAIQRTDEEFVILNPEKCIGCLMCALACPFGHPRYEKEYKTVIKCDFCIDRIREGREPACVEACPTEALKFGTLEELMREVAKEKAQQLLTGLAAAPGKILVLPGLKEVEVKPAPPIKPSDVISKYSRVRWV